MRSSKSVSVGRWLSVYILSTIPVSETLDPSLLLNAVTYLPTRYRMQILGLTHVFLYFSVNSQNIILVIDQLKNIFKIKTEKYEINK